jgi:peptide/nickel transport system permease protein
MLIILLRRLYQAIFVLLLVALISFCIFRFVGDPVDNILGQEATVEDRNEMIDRMGLDDPIIVQYGRFIWNAVRGEFGISYRTAEPVSGLIAQRLPATLELAFVSAFFALFFGVILGVYTAVRRQGFLAHFIMTASLVGVSLPTFLIGVLLIWLFARTWMASFLWTR